MSRKRLDYMQLQTNLEKIRPKVKLHNPANGSYSRVVYTPASSYRFLSVQLCIKPPSKFFKMLGTYICAVMEKSHPAYRSYTKTKFVLFNRDMTRGVSVTANIILQCFKPIPNAEEALMGEMRILSSEGDSKIVWDVKKSAEIEAAETQFDMLVGEKNYQAYYVGKTGKKSGKMKKFDPDAEKMILVPPIVGG